MQCNISETIIPREPDDYALLAPLLEITTGLDPHLIVAYDFGASFLASKPPLGAGEPQRAMDLMKYGNRNNPDNWRLYQNLGFIYYLELKDYAAAADAFEHGVQIAQCASLYEDYGGPNGPACRGSLHRSHVVGCDL